MWQLPKLVRGDRVRVRSKEQILATLDADGAVDGMPFMPEMLQFCGRELTVAAVAHKTCDTANRTGGRKLDRTVHLAESRCDGRAHGGCDADCNLFWKEVWLERADDAGKAAPAPFEASLSQAGKAGCTEDRLMQCTRVAAPEGGPARYRCQATQLFAASKPLAWWNARQFVLDVRTGNASAGEVLRVIWLALLYQLRELPWGYRAWRTLYEWMHRRLTGRAAPHVTGAIRLGDPTPVAVLNLQPGEAVRVKSAAEIVATLNTNNKNRGIWFGPEQVPYCGGTFKVRRRVAQIIDERTGELIPMKTPCITLENALCRGHYSSGRMFCPRLITPYWRELWLERVGRSGE
jgi:hypothetical protein